jgi:CRP-like cAMP-binding protein
VSDNRIEPEDRPSVELYQVPLFAGVSRSEIHVVLAACKMQTFLVGDEIFSEGDAGDSLWIIEAGHVEVFKTIKGNVDRVLDSFTPGQVFGEMSFLDGSRRSASARATEPTHVSMLTRSTFDKLAEQHPRIAAIFYAGLARVVAERLRETSAAYAKALSDVMELTGATSMTLSRLVDDVRVVTVHFVGAAQPLRATLVELHHQPQGWAMILKDDKGKVSIVPYTAVARIEVG